MDPNLKKAYQSIEPDHSELRRYRAGLATRLADVPSSAGLPTWLLWFCLPLAAAAVWFFALQPNGLDLDKQSIDDLHVIAAKQPPQKLLAQVKPLLNDPNPVTQGNALALTSMLAAGGEAMTAAAKGLQEDSRPDFRAYYIEFMMDRVGEYWFNVDTVEALIERETDPICLALLEDWLHALQRSDAFFVASS